MVAETEGADDTRDPDKVAFGELVRYARQAVRPRMTQSSLAAAVFGYSESDRGPHISMIESGRFGLKNKDIVKKICTELNIDPLTVPESLRWSEAEGDVKHTKDLVEKTLGVVTEIKEDLIRAQRSTEREFSKPESLELCIQELNAIDKKFSVESPQSSEVHLSLSKRKSYLTDWLLSEVQQTYNPEDYIAPLCDLQKIDAWFNYKLRLQKNDYANIALTLLSSIDINASGVIDLCSETAENLYSNDRRLEAYEMIHRFRRKLIYPKTETEISSVIEQSDVFIESGALKPGDLRHLVEGLPGDEKAMEYAKWSRCYACRLIAQPNFEMALSALNDAREWLERAGKQHKDYNLVKCYLDSLSIIIRWRSGKFQIDEFKDDLWMTMNDVIIHASSDKPMLAALSEIELEIICYGVGESSVRGSLHRVLQIAHQIKGNLRESVPSHCMLNVKSTILRAENIIENPLLHYPRLMRKE